MDDVPFGGLERTTELLVRVRAGEAEARERLLTRYLPSFGAGRTAGGQATRAPPRTRMISFRSH